MVVVVPGAAASPPPPPPPQEKRDRERNPTSITRATILFMYSLMLPPLNDFQATV